MDNPQNYYAALRRLSGSRRWILERSTQRLESFATEARLGALLSVPCQPLSHCAERRCFTNVEAQVALHGGTVQAGWLFYEFENLCIIGEAHAVWRTGDELTDITPHDLTPRTIIFACDDVVGQKKTFTAPPRLLISEDPYFRKVERFERIIDKLIDSRCVEGAIISLDADDLEQASEEAGVPPEIAVFLVQNRQRSLGVDAHS